MTRNSRRGRCVHCLRSVDRVTSDHVFPEAWYPESTPRGLEKWQVPACFECNQRHGRFETDLLLRIALCTDPADLRSLGISDRVHRSMDPAYARNERDRQHRINRRNKLLSQLIPASAIPPESVFPGFGPYREAAPEDQIGIGLPKDGIEALVEKIVRGITYVLDGKYIEDDHKIEIFFQHEADAGPFQTVLSRFGKQHHRGPGISVARAVPQDDPVSGVFEIEIWGRFKAWATVQPKLPPTNTECFVEGGDRR
jgi:hypothetical protein